MRRLNKSITETEKILELLNNIVHGIDDGIMLLDRDYRIIFANKSANEIFHAPCITDQACHDVFHGLSLPCSKTGISDMCPHDVVCKTGRPANKVLHYVVKNKGERIFNVT
ncbi:MAG: PAS domain-containing protein, partial [Nitrospirae bacterium]|nr:PAS domain-containing protein [Nitrospirota bacterium]